MVGTFSCSGNVVVLLEVKIAKLVGKLSATVFCEMATWIFRQHKNVCCEKPCLFICPKSYFGRY